MPSDTPWLQPLQRTQRTLAMGVHTLDSGNILARETWQRAAEHLSRRWFPRSQELAIAELIHECYLQALWWYPILQQRCPGTIKPTWHAGTVLTWLRRAASMSTHQWFFASIDIKTQATAEAAICQAQALPGTGDASWIEMSLEYLEMVSATGKRKAVIPTYILEMLSFLPWDRELDALLGCRESAHRRRIRRAKKQGTSSRLRCGHTQYLLADSQLAKHAAELGWVDLREVEVQVLEYLIRAKEDTEKAVMRLVIRLQDNVVADARSHIKAIVTGRRPAPARLSALRRFLRAFEADHRYAPGAWRQFVEISKYAKGQAKRHIKSQLPREADKSLPAIRTANTLIIPGMNPFMDYAPLEEWERWFSPYRCGFNRGEMK